MARPDAKLQTLMRLLSHREAEAKRRLAAHREAVAGAEAQAEQLSGLAREYETRLQTAGSAGLNAGEMRMWRQFNRSLGDVVDVQGVQVERLRAELEQAQSACLAALVKRRGGERLEASERHRQASLERRRERVQASDQAARRDRSD
tara:strand:- start:890 stop:1330 length:441 start_codon:yes stop_codon:yes gene_type:complete